MNKFGYNYCPAKCKCTAYFIQILIIQILMYYMQPCVHVLILYPACIKIPLKVIVQMSFCQVHWAIFIVNLGQFQKHSSEGVLVNGCLERFCNFTGKHLCMSVTLLKKRFQYRCFPVNFAKLLRAPILNNCERLLLQVVRPNSQTLV